MCYLIFIQINFNKTILNKRRAIHMFVGREQELASLEEFYAKDGIGMTVIYGRRRIGSLLLLPNLSKIKKLYFIRQQKSEKPEIWSYFPNKC